MIQSKNLFVILLALAVVFSAVMILVVNIQKSNSPNSQSPLTGFMTGVTAIKMDTNGYPRTVLTSPLFQYFQSKNYILIETPRMTINPNQSTFGSWVITANKAITFLENTTVNLRGHVNITRNKTKNLPKTTFITSSLTIDPNKNKAFTDKTVTILQPNNNITAKGLRANLKTGVISLVSKASGEFDPNSN